MDGSTLKLTLPKGDSGPLDTLVRYSVEKSFNLKGSIRQILSGEDPLSLNSSPESWQADAVVKAIKDHQGSGEVSMALLRSTIFAICETVGVVPPAFSAMKFDEAKRLIQSLEHDWQRLKAGQSLELSL